MKKILVHSQNIDKVVFLGKVGRLLEITKIEVLNPAVKVLINYWNHDYKCFSFENRGIQNVDEIFQTSAQSLFHFEKW
jgi:hypothetical protein